jgi:2'-5' RNA ligase
VSLRGALVLVLPEPRLEAIRARFDARAVAAGIPLHITLLFPFGLGEDGLEEVFAPWSPLRFSLARVEVFPEAAAWLAPEPVDELRRRILELYARYPQYPPYGGEFPDPTPHATIGQPADVADAVRAAAEPLLPIELEVGAATLMEEVAPDRWRAGPSFPFEGAA